jgi:hypothetical protein
VKVGFKAFLNITPAVTHAAPPPPSPTKAGGPAAQPSAAGSSFTLTLDDNPLAEFVELPEEALEGGLWFSNVLCGVLRGSLEMVSQRMHGAVPCFVDKRTGSNASPGRVRIRCVARRRDNRNSRETHKVLGRRSSRRRGLNAAWSSQDVIPGRIALRLGVQKCMSNVKHGILSGSSCESQLNANSSSQARESKIMALRGGRQAGSTPPLYPVQLLRRARIRARVLTTDGKTHGMPQTNVAANHTLVLDVLAHLPTELGLNLEVSERVCTTTWTNSDAPGSADGLGTFHPCVLDFRRGYVRWEWLVTWARERKTLLWGRSVRRGEEGRK